MNSRVLPPPPGGESRKFAGRAASRNGLAALASTAASHRWMRPANRKWPRPSSVTRAAGAFRRHAPPLRQATVVLGALPCNRSSQRRITRRAAMRWMAVCLAAHRPARVTRVAGVARWYCWPEPLARVDRPGHGAGHRAGPNRQRHAPVSDVLRRRPPCRHLTRLRRYPHPRRRLSGPQHRFDLRPGRAGPALLRLNSPYSPAAMSLL
jgi:hypothetical protein